MGRRKQTDPETPPPEETPVAAADPQPDAFVQVKAEEPSAPRRQSIRVPLTDTGIDWDSLSTSKAEQLLQTLVTDDKTKAALMGDGQPEAVNRIEPKHVCSLLEVFAMAERMFLPRAIKAKLGIKLSPVVVSRAFVFSEEQKGKLGSSGAEAANFYLPERVRGWIISASAGTEFGAVLSEAIQQQVLLAIQLQAQEERRAEQSRPPTNGEYSAPVAIDSVKPQ